MAWPIDKLFAPKSVAVVGASTRSGSVGNSLIRNFQLLDFAGPVYPVNPRYQEVEGLPCYPSLSELPGQVDAVFIALAAASGPEALEEAGRRGIPAALVNASGYADGGPDGKALQDRLTAIANEYGIAVCGPNNMGLLNVHDRIKLWSSPRGGMPRAGSVAAISQSGSVAMVLSLDERDLGIAYVVTAGNEAVLTAADYLQFFIRDERVSIVLMFLETIRDPELFEQAAEEARALGKHIIVVKVGRSEGARQAAMAHTGAIAGEDRLYDAFFRRHGIIRAADIDEMLETAVLISSFPEPPPTPTVVPITLSGGEAALVADLGEELGLSIPPLSPETIERLQVEFPPFSTPRNPVDAYGLGWDPERFNRILETLVADPEVGTIVIATDSPKSGGFDERFAMEMGHMFRKLAPTTSTRFVFINNTASAGVHAGVKEIYDKAGVPHLLGMREGIAALVHWIHCDRTAGGAASAPEDMAAEWRRRAAECIEIGDRQRFALLADAGIPMVHSEVVADADEAVSAAQRLGFPVALKGTASSIGHKTDLGLVRLGLSGADELRAAFADVAALLDQELGDRGNGEIIVQPMAGEGVELIVGVRNVKGFGSMIVVGLGGVFAEVLKDASAHMAPVDRDTALAMFEETQVSRLLQGYRNAGPFDIEAAADAVVALSQFGGATAGVLSAVEINPLIVGEKGQGVVGVDALFEAASDDEA